jgi:hypothetical protein
MIETELVVPLLCYCLIVTVSLIIAKILGISKSNFTILCIAGISGSIGVVISTISET